MSCVPLAQVVSDINCVPNSVPESGSDSASTRTTPVSAPTITCCITMSRGLKDSPLQKDIFLTDFIELQDTDNRNIALQRLAARLDKKFAKDFHIVKKK